MPARTMAGAYLGRCRLPMPEDDASVASAMASDRIRTALARFIPVRGKLALASLVLGILITIPAFYLHDLWLALIGALPLGGGLALLLIPLPHTR
ncbi:MAG: hypothetical protein ACREK3_08450 [Gemmatimonadota bacterium]